MKRTDYFFSTINASIESGKKTRIHWLSNTKIPQFGQFVNLNDADELRNKGFARFVSESKLDKYDAATPQRRMEYTRLILVKDLLTILIF